MVATVLTVYGIETAIQQPERIVHHVLQQCLPFTVLKHNSDLTMDEVMNKVATVLTVYGIETKYQLG